jgi:DNA-directed RNA polymerase sigma subunit (sigma70/sigma32)
MRQEHQSIRDQLLSKLNSAYCPTLTEEEQEVLILRWGLQAGALLSLEAVANKLGKSREYVRTTEQKALNKLQA